MPINFRTKTFDFNNLRIFNDKTIAIIIGKPSGTYFSKKKLKKIIFNFLNFCFEFVNRKVPQQQ